MCDIKTPLLLLIVQGSMYQYSRAFSSLPKLFLTVRRMTFADFSDFLSKRPVSFLLFSFFILLCVPLPVFLAKEESTAYEQLKCFVSYNLCPLFGTTRARN